MSWQVKNAGDLLRSDDWNDFVQAFLTHKTLHADTIVGTGEDYTDPQEALDDGHLNLFLKRETFSKTTPLVVGSDNVTIQSNGAEIKATQAVDRLIDLRTAKYTHLLGLNVNGNNLATRCIDAYRTPSACPVHSIAFTKVFGGIDCNVDYTGCEDSDLVVVWLDGRKDLAEPPTVYTEYGLRFGRDGDGHRTGGQVNVWGLKAGFHKKADIFAKNIAHLKFFGSLFSSKYNWNGADLEAHLVVEGGTGGGSLWPNIIFDGCWFDGGLGAHPNVLIRNVRAQNLEFDGCVIFGDAYPNIYSVLDPALSTLILKGEYIERQPGGYNVDCIMQMFLNLGCDYSIGNGVDLTKCTKYFEIRGRVPDKIHTNLEMGA